MRNFWILDTFTQVLKHIFYILLNNFEHRLGSFFFKIKTLEYSLSNLLYNNLFVICVETILFIYTYKMIYIQPSSYHLVSGKSKKKKNNYNKKSYTFFCSTTVLINLIRFRFYFEYFKPINFVNFCTWVIKLLTIL